MDILLAVICQLLERFSKLLHSAYPRLMTRPAKILAETL